MATVQASASSEEVRQLLRSVPAILAGHAPDPYGIARALQLRLGVALLSKIQQAYVAKARGGRGDDGIQWRPLKASTVAGRRRGKADGVPEIGRDSGRTLSSFSPGQDGKPSGAPGQVLETPPGRVLVGTAVPYAGYQHRGTRRTPARPFWPLDGSMPPAWSRALADQLRQGVAQAIQDVLAKRRRA